MDINELWKMAIRALPPELGPGFTEKTEFTYDQDQNTGTLKASFRDTPIELNFISAYRVTHAMVPLLKQLAESKKQVTGKKTIIITSLIYPKIAAELMQAGLYFIDSHGSIYLVQDKIALMRLAGTPKEKPASLKQSRLFGESGIRFLFGILQNSELINRPFREIADATLISAASVTILIGEMMHTDYLHIGMDGKRIISEKKKLLDRWAIAYNEKLRPKLFIGSYLSRSTDLKEHFRKIRTEDFGGLWGGEAAANIYTNYLSPEKLTLYTTGENRKWIKELKLIPSDKNALIDVYRTFWNEKSEYLKHPPHLVHQILVYADLMVSTDSRNIETANRIFNEHIQFTN